MHCSIIDAIVARKSVFNIDTDVFLVDITLLLGDTSPLGTH
jgi:hypothetical protein